MFKYPVKYREKTCIILNIMLNIVESKPVLCLDILLNLERKPVLY